MSVSSMHTALSLEQRYDDKAIGRNTSEDPSLKRQNVEECMIERLRGSKREEWAMGQLLETRLC
jgi:hypothetical protein